VRNLNAAAADSHLSHTHVKAADCIFISPEPGDEAYMPGQPVGWPAAVQQRHGQQGMVSK
jgi:hypothetical protein